MSVEVYDGERSEESIQIEKVLATESNKKSFSSIENTKLFLEQKGTENTKPYVIGKDVKFSSDVQEQTVDDIQIFTLNNQKSSKQKVILYIHGGAWTSQPLDLHWLFMDNMAHSLDAKVIAPIYPKLPHFNYQHTYPKILKLYKDILATVESPDQLTIMGDSAGGNISLGLVHLLKVENVPQPKDIILLSACVNMIFDNPLIPEYEENDPILARKGLQEVAQKWAADRSLNDPLINPMYGDFKGSGKITHFIGTHEALYPDAIKFDKKLTEQGVQINTLVYPKMNHVFVVIPIPEAQNAQQKIINIIR
ncbi:alpha/beta hydrolase fold domain-containing protein [Paenibacillus nicotianae]|uniref:Alpha/beta hydrolase fold domain-containing protein n=1 Tax=Paenibacillus nicotianae TaxID=1526551 RepID=A0ABW4UST9_9BACL